MGNSGYVPPPAPATTAQERLIRAQAYEHAARIADEFKHGDGFGSMAAKAIAKRLRTLASGETDGGK